MAQQRPGEREESQDGYEKELADYEMELARYLQARIKPGLSRGAIPLLARSVAKEIAGQEPPEQIPGSDAPEAGGGPGAGFEADMHELQAELGDDWILRFSVHGGDGWLTAEKQDSSQRVEAATAEQLVKIVEAIDDQDDGRLEEGVGGLTDNKRLKDEGRADSAAGTAKKEAGRGTDEVKEVLD